MAQDDPYEADDAPDELDDDLDDEGPAPTPFDHPLFLPGLLFAFTLWFGYDGFFNEEMKEKGYEAFNRWGFALFAVLTLWFGWSGLKIMRQEGEGSGDDDDGAGG